MWHAICLRLLALTALLSGPLGVEGAESVPRAISTTAYYQSKWYDWAFYGPYPRRWFKSFQRLGSPRLNFLKWDDRCDKGYTFIEPRGVMVSKPGPAIMDSNGELIWIEDKYGQAMDFKMQSYNGSNYLTFWAGKDSGTYGSGKYYMLDSSYEVYKIVEPAGGGNLTGDLHEFHITKNDTALMTIYEPAIVDLTSIGGPKKGWIYDSLFQEVNLTSGELIFQWRASDHYSMNETYKHLKTAGRDKKDALDFFHINSIDKDDHGNYIISSRYMQTITCIRPTGEIKWILGGKRNMFKDLSDGAATNFTWQHHVRVHENNTLTIFDNGKFAKGYFIADKSRALLVSLDLEQMTVTLLQDYIDPKQTPTPSQGSVQLLDNGNVLVGWGYHAAYTEYTRDGEILCDVHIGPQIMFDLGWLKSYRTFRNHDWVGKPNTKPDVYYRPRDGRLYVSWNGATEVDRWVLEGARGPHAESYAFFTQETIYKQGFESSIEVTSDMMPWIRVTALDRKGNILGHSEVVGRTTGNAGWTTGEIWSCIFFVLLIIPSLWLLRKLIPMVIPHGVRTRITVFRKRLIHRLIQFLTQKNGCTDTPMTEMEEEMKNEELEPLYTSSPE